MDSPRRSSKPISRLRHAWVTYSPFAAQVVASRLVGCGLLPRSEWRKRMKAKRFLGVLLAGGLGLVAMSQSSDVLAAGGKPKKEAAPAAPTEAPTTKKAIAHSLTGVVWGQTPKQVAEAIDKI